MYPLLIRCAFSFLVPFHFFSLLPCMSDLFRILLRLHPLSFPPFFFSFFLPSSFHPFMYIYRMRPTERACSPPGCLWFRWRLAPLSAGTATRTSPSECPPLEPVARLVFLLLLSSSSSSSSLYSFFVSSCCHTFLPSTSRPASSTPSLSWATHPLTYTLLRARTQGLRARWHYRAQGCGGCVGAGQEVRRREGTAQGLRQLDVNNRACPVGVRLSGRLCSSGQHPLVAEL
jgi:hypothetical protein